MNRMLPILMLSSVVLAANGFSGSTCQGAALPRPGGWRVEFSNHVVEVVKVGNGGECSVSEPARTSPGKAETEGGSIVITYGDDRVERWTLVGSKYVVEHWFPASSRPTGAPVLGIAEWSR